MNRIKPTLQNNIVLTICSTFQESNYFQANTPGCRCHQKYNGKEKTMGYRILKYPAKRFIKSSM